MEESSSNRKYAIVATKTSVIAVKVIFYVASFVLIIFLGVTFTTSLNEVRDLVEEGVIPRPLFTFVLTGICLAAIPLILRRIK